MDSVTPSSEKMGNATPYVNKKWVACTDNKTVFNNHETHTLHVFNNEQMRSLIHKNTVQ